MLLIPLGLESNCHHLELQHVNCCKKFMKIIC